MSTKEEKVEKAKKIVAAKLGFIRHFTVYAIVIGALAIINNATSPEYQWWLWPTLGWGIAVLINFFSVFVFTGSSLQKN